MPPDTVPGDDDSSPPTAAGMAKRVYPHLFRHQFITYLTKQGIISPKLQLLSGHTTEQSLAFHTRGWTDSLEGLAQVLG